MDWLSITGTAASVGGLGVSLYIFHGVRQLAAAKQAERELMREILWIDEIDVELKQLADTLTASGEAALLAWALRLAELRGKLAGSAKTLENVVGAIGTKYTVVPTGYYAAPFFRERVATAQREVLILAYGNRRLTDYGILEVLATRLNHGCRVTILTISSDAPEPVLELCRQKLPAMPKDCSSFRKQLDENTSIILTFFKEKVAPEYLANLYYLQYPILPRIHVTRVDETLYVGFTNVNPDKINIMHGGLRVTPYIIVPAKSVLGQFVLAQLTYFQDHSASVIPPAYRALGAGGEGGGP